MRRPVTIWTVGASLAVLVGPGAPRLSGQSGAPSSTAAGRAAYQENCASCHHTSLAGRNEAPPLAGSNVMSTRANAKALKLAWVWSTYEGGANQPSPIVHDGIMYLVNPLNIPQALDARTGELIWENHIGPEQAVGMAAIRNMSIYGNKVYFTTTDARLVALNAKPGQVVWDTQIADRWKGNDAATAGSVVINGKLYVTSTLALNSDDEKLAWHFQHIPGEALDQDEVFERVLVDIADRKYAFHIGKACILWKLDRKTGPHVAHKETIFQNVFDRIDAAAGKPVYRADIIAAKDQWIAACPSTEGGHNGQAMSYHRPSTVRRQQRAPFLTGVLTTAGDVGFVGDLDRTFRAFDVRTGETLWQARLGASRSGFPVTHAAAAGLGGGSPRLVRRTITPDVKHPNGGNAVYVFELSRMTLQSCQRPAAPQALTAGRVEDRDGTRGARPRASRWPWPLST